MKLSLIPPSPRVLLYGYGVEGKSSEAWLKKQRPESVFEIYEDRTPHPAPTPLSQRGGAAEFINNKSIDLPSLSKEGTEGCSFDQYDLIIKSPGVPPRNIPAEYHAKVTSNWRLFTENLTEAQRQKLIGITGSKGKSTTAKFSHELLQKAGFNSVIIGNYGVPALDSWDQLENLDYVVAECSSFQLNDATVSPHYALFLSFFLDHLEWHEGDDQHYFKAKQNLWRYQQPGDYLLAPAPLRPLVQPDFTYDNPPPLPPGIQLTQAVPAELFPPDSTLRAEHFRQNLGTVWALGEKLGIKNLAEVWQQTAKDFAMIEHRLERVVELRGVEYYNDSIATSPDAVEAAVRYLGPRLGVLIMDGQDTGLGGFDALAEVIRQQAPQARLLLLESDVAEQMLQSAAGAQLPKPVMVDSLEAAILQAQNLAKPGQVVLLSPGGKSFNRFKNYGERGKYFKNLVKSLLSNLSS